MKITNELRTGIVVVAAILVGIFLWSKTAVKSASRPYRLKTFFNYAEGIRPDSIVKLSGIEVGRVEKIKFDYTPETRVKLTLVLDKSAKVHEDSLAYITTSGMVGDAFIGLTPGSADKPFAKEGSTLMSEDPIELRKLFKKADSIAENLDKTLVEVKDLAQNLTGVVKDNKPKIENIVINLETTSVNFKDFSDDIKRHPWTLLMKGKETKGKK